jgi:hypothetical protein
MMSTAPKITETHWLAASKKFTTGHTVMDVCNKAIEIALAEQKSIEMIRNIDIDWQEPYITAAQARELGVGNAEIRNAFGDWVICQGNIYGYPNDAKYRAIKQESEYITAEQARELGAGNAEYSDSRNKWHIVEDHFCFPTVSAFNGSTVKYRAIKQAQPEPVDPNAALRAEYAKQVVEGTTRFYLWEFNYENRGWESVGLNTPIFDNQHEYRCTDISCYVSKDGDTAIRMLRTDAQELQAKTRDECDWFTPFSSQLDVDDDFFSFCSNGTYTYRTKATIKLDGNMLTPEQAEAEWKAKKETHDVWASFRGDDYLKVIYAGFLLADYPATYELRLKQPTWTGSREDVIALLKEMGVL